METIQGREPRQSAPPYLPSDPNRALAWEGHHGPYAWADVVQQGARQAQQREERLGNALGWFSIGLGLVELLAPRAVARTLGMPPQWTPLLRLFGARELACGIGLLSQPRSPAWRWARVAGDALDTAALGAAMFAPAGQRRRLAATAAVASGIIALDLRAGMRQRRSPSSEELPGQEGRRRVQKAMTINRSPEDCYRQWRDFGSFPSFMQHVESVEVVDERHSHWCASAPGGRQVEWDAEIIEDEPGRRLAWRSVPGSQVDNRGTVQFEVAPGGKGCEVQVVMEYEPPAGAAGAAIAMLFGEEPAQQVEGDLRRFKQLMETGEIPTTRGQSHGTRSLKARLLNKEIEQ